MRLIVPNRKFSGGFLLIEPLFALLIFATITGYLTCYVARLFSIHYDINSRLQAVQLAQHTIEKILIEKKIPAKYVHATFNVTIKKNVSQRVSMVEKFSTQFLKNYAIIECIVSWKTTLGFEKSITLATGCVLT